MTLLKILSGILAITIVLALINPGLAGAALVYMLVATAVYGFGSVIFGFFKGKKD